MARRSTLNVSLTPRHRKLVSAEVSSGRYGSASEVVREGLRLLEEKREHAGLLDRMRREIVVGVEQADRGELLDADAVFGEIRERSASRRARRA